MVIEINSGGNENSQIVILMTIHLLSSSALHSLGTRGLIVWLYHHTLSLSPVRIFQAIHFLYFPKLALQHVFKKEGVWYKVNDHAEKAARFLHVRQILPQDNPRCHESKRVRMSKP